MFNFRITMITISLLIAGAYSCLRVQYTFARQLSFFIVTIYIPCFMIVVVSWMSFWIDYKAVSIYTISYYTKISVKIAYLISRMPISKTKL